MSRDLNDLEPMINAPHYTCGVTIYHSNGDKCVQLTQRNRLGGKILHMYVQLDRQQLNQLTTMLKEEGIL